MTTTNRWDTMTDEEVLAEYAETNGITVAEVLAAAAEQQDVLDEALRSQEG